VPQINSRKAHKHSKCIWWNFNARFGKTFSRTVSRKINGYSFSFIVKF
jgi:hypothetical protein